ncbi:hypothetical protein Ccrd_014554 [Cynara cardunculus var. scolymus]|uniref:Uncharacterized protein n=1 Tax=Cynara cardunculus var. scolymus TaxID=59895 RepID=A0A103YDG6_CYNCS|nr:hypothetical protein Ccrd_014554 [Cynara cardunculus var. scolymus]
MFPNNLTMLYHVLDLLSLKLLWNSRSLGHSLCASPICEPVIGEFTKLMKKLSKQADLPLEVEFHKSLSVMSTLSSPCTQPLVTTDDIKKAASHRIKSDLIFAKKAEGLRAKLFSEYFGYTTKLQEAIYVLGGHSNQTHNVVIDNIHIHSSMELFKKSLEIDMKLLIL